jgi:hypothetical protein
MSDWMVGLSHVYTDTESTAKINVINIIHVYFCISALFMRSPCFGVCPINVELINQFWRNLAWTLWDLNKQILVIFNFLQ